MTGRIDQHLRERGIEIPEVAPPRFNYVPVVLSRGQAWVAGQVPYLGAEIRYQGALGKDLALEAGQAAARLCMLNVLGQLKLALGGDLDRVRRAVKVVGYVACTPDFTAQPLVMNAASDLLVEVFGEAGRHARSAVGTPSLPLNAAVEVDAVFEID
jgi:enamine deaminase RidA (YjgF/YER057c/UK114 family)